MDVNPGAAGRALAVITADHANEESRALAKIVTELLEEDGFYVDGVVVVPNDEDEIRKAIETGVVGGVDLLLTVGGVGLSPRHHTPEATLPLIDRALPGIAEALRSSGQSAGAPDACVSRGVVGISGSTLVANLSNSRAAVRDGMATLLPLARYVINEISSLDIF